MDREKRKMQAERGAERNQIKDGGKEEKQKKEGRSKGKRGEEKDRGRREQNKIKNWLVYFLENYTFLKTRMYDLLVPQGLQIFYQFLFQLGNSCSATYSESNDKISYYILQKNTHCIFHF